jgi:hypothetical protein
MTDFEKLLAKAAGDTEFASLLANSPADALKQLGIDPTQEKLDALAACRAPMRAAYDAFGGQLDPG